MADFLDALPASGLDMVGVGAGVTEIFHRIASEGDKYCSYTRRCAGVPLLGTWPRGECFLSQPKP